MTIKSIPMPKARAFGGNKGASKYDFDKLTPGTDECLVFDTVDPAKTTGKLHSAIGAYRKRKGADAGKFSVRVFKAEDGVTDQVGVWRTA